MVVKIQVMSLPLIVRQWLAFLNIYIQEGITYKAAGVIWILTDVSTAVTMPFVWIAASRGGEIAGYGAPDFVLYYLVMLFASTLISSHFMWEIGYEIREGVFTSHLIRPFSYLQFILARNLAWRVVRSALFLPWMVIFVVMFWQWLGGAQLYFGWQVWALILGGHLVSVLVVTALGLIAMFTGEIDSIFNLYYFPMLFLSGRLVPVDLMPEWVRTLAAWTPFYYQLDVPTRAIMGRMTEAQMLQALGGQLAWIVVAYAGYRLLWHYGRRVYTGVGM